MLESLICILFQWFKGGVTNICYNCLDKNVEAGIGDKIAIYWEGNEPGFDGTLTYTQLLHKVCQVNYLIPHTPHTHTHKTIIKI